MSPGMPGIPDSAPPPSGVLPVVPLLLLLPPLPLPLLPLLPLLPPLLPPLPPPLLLLLLVVPPPEPPELLPAPQEAVFDESPHAKRAPARRTTAASREVVVRNIPAAPARVMPGTNAWKLRGSRKQCLRSASFVGLGGSPSAFGGSRWRMQ
jgi:hypothetical protein